MMFITKRYIVYLIVGIAVDILKSTEAVKNEGKEIDIIYQLYSPVTIACFGMSRL